MQANMVADDQHGGVIPAGDGDVPPGISKNAAPGHPPVKVSLLKRGVRGFRSASIERKFLIVLLCMFAAKGIAITFIHQPFTGHDEVAHYSYLEIVATQGRVPNIPDLTTWNAEYLAKKPDTADRMPAKLWPYCSYVTKDWNFCHDPRCNDPCYLQNIPPDYKVGPNGWIYTANHPPLYYIYLTPVYWLTEHLSPSTQLYFLRLATIPFGLIAVLFAYLTVRVLFPIDRFMAMTVPAFVAFQPQISYESSMLNNDIVAIAFTSVVLHLVVLGLKKRFPVWNCVLLGTFYGLAVLSKNTSLTAGLIIAFAIIAGLGWRNWKQWVPKGTVAAGVAGLVVWPWFLYLWATYGNFTALAQIKALQWWNYQGTAPPTIWSMLSNKRFFWARWQETWGAFGWRMIPLSDTLLRIIFYPVLLAVIGLAIYAWRFWKLQKPLLQAESNDERLAVRRGADSTLAIVQWQVVAIVTLALTCVVAYYAILQFGLTFSLTQARYFFPAINAGAILIMLGVRSWFPRKWLPYVALVVFVSLVALNFYIYTGYVVPWNLTGQFAKDQGF
jgi:4-amino-4-deoxy-L-arabinose transferase-like glycosyltransferase